MCPFPAEESRLLSAQGAFNVPGGQAHPPGFTGASVSHAEASCGVKARETEQDFTLTLDAPGFEPSEFDIQVLQDTVTISAEHNVTEGEETRTERSLNRQFTLSTVVDPSKVEAKYRNGVLEIRLPKAESAKSRKVEVIA